MAEAGLRVLSIFGTRPEAIKMAPVVGLLATQPGVESRVCITAQHRQMLDPLLDLFGIHPDFDLDLMRPDQPLVELTQAILGGLDPVIRQVRPDWILVQGDTTTVMAASLLAYYQHVRVGHIEAGLRTGDKWQPFPEEINRRVAGAIADLHFAPTARARENLIREGTPEDRIIVTGNTVIDALQMIISRPCDLTTGPLAGIPAERRIILVTAHRRENFGEPFQHILRAMEILARTYPDDVTLIYPVHLNPNVREPALEKLGDVENIRLIEPLDYSSMVHLMKRSTLILTDSGGLQEEAPALGVPVLVMREKTERPEAVEAGTARLVGTDTQRIVTEAKRLMDDPQAHAAMAHAVNPFGDGKAAERIVEALLGFDR
jgi:UDP-N-acetylglucosamine 2-epimerase (non-hydrolysing)